MNNQHLKTRARVAALTRHHPNDKTTVDLARDFKAERLAEYIERVVDSAPPLTQAQRDRLAALLAVPIDPSDTVKVTKGNSTTRRVKEPGGAVR
jgi:hypothetical protein